MMMVLRGCARDAAMDADQCRRYVRTRVWCRQGVDWGGGVSGVVCAVAHGIGLCRSRCGGGIVWVQRGCEGRHVCARCVLACTCGVVCVCARMPTLMAT